MAKKQRLTDDQGKLTFTTMVVPDMWADIDRVLAKVPRDLDVRRIGSCPAFAQAAKERAAIALLLAMQKACERYYLPLFFEVLRAACLRPLVREKYAPAPAEIDAEAWKAQYEVPWGSRVRQKRRNRTVEPTVDKSSGRTVNGTQRAKESSNGGNKHVR